MASLDSLRVRERLKTVTLGQVGSDEPVGIRLKYIGTGTVTSVTVITATNIVNITSDGGTDTYTFATYTTIGAVRDAINADGIFEAKVLDCLRSDASASTLVNGAISSSTVDGVTVYDVLVDTSTLKQLSWRVTTERLFNAVIGGHRVGIKQIVYNATLGAAAADKFQIWKAKAANPSDSSKSTETQLMGALSVSASETTPLNLTSSNQAINGKDGEDLIVVLKDATSITDAAANFLRVMYEVE